MTNQKSSRIFNQDVFKRDHVMLLNNKAQTEEKFTEIVVAEILPKQDKILLDLLWKAYRCALDQRFSVEQIATFLSITNFIFIESFQAKMVHLESYALLKQILNNHTFQAPPYSLGIFTQDQVQHINKFMRNYFYRYFSLYETKQNVQCEYTIATLRQTEDWPVLEDLSQGISVNTLSSKLLQFQVNEQTRNLEELEPNNSDFAEQAIIKKVMETRETKEINHDKQLEATIDKLMIQNFNQNLTVEQRNAALFEQLK